MLHALGLFEACMSKPRGSHYAAALSLSEACMSKPGGSHYAACTRLV